MAETRGNLAGTGQTKALTRYDTSTGAPPWLVNNLSQDNALPWQKYIDPSVSDTINQQLDRVGLFPNAQNNNSGRMTNLDKAGGMPQASPQGDYYNDSLGKNVNFGVQKANTGNPMTDAIYNKYSQDYAPKYGALKTNFDIGKSSWQSGQLNKAGSELGAIQKNQMQNFAEQYQFQLQRQQLFKAWKQNQQSVLGSILGGILKIGGAAAGFVLGGPPGAAAGAAGGGAVAGVLAGQGG